MKALKLFKSNSMISNLPKLLKKF